MLGERLATGTNSKGGMIERRRVETKSSRKRSMINFAGSLPTLIPAQLYYLSEEKSSRSTNCLPSNSVFVQLPFPLPPQMNRVCISE